ALLLMVRHRAPSRRLFGASTICWDAPPPSETRIRFYSVRYDSRGPLYRVERVVTTANGLPSICTPLPRTLGPGAHIAELRAHVDVNEASPPATLQFTLR